MTNDFCWWNITFEGGLPEAEAGLGKQNTVQKMHLFFLVHASQAYIPFLSA